MKIIVTGATGMVGEGVMLSCLRSPDVEEVLSISRRPCGHTHPKLKELLVADFLKLESLPSGYDACFFCAGVSSVGMTEAEYTRITYDTTLHFAKLLASPTMTFVYVTGAGTDSSEQGKVMWARVKGRTENALTRLGFKAVYNYRPGGMKPVAGQKHVKWYFRPLLALFPVFRVLAPRFVSTLDDVASSMRVVATRGFEKSVLEVTDINTIAAAARAVPSTLR